MQLQRLALFTILAAFPSSACLAQADGETSKAPPPPNAAKLAAKEAKVLLASDRGAFYLASDGTGTVMCNLKEEDVHVAALKLFREDDHFAYYREVTGGNRRWAVGKTGGDIRSVWIRIRQDHPLLGAGWKFYSGMRLHNSKD